MASIENVMIRASAGSGKTWQLANRYLALLALGVKPERVIALTFTRKAAGEFADRILTRLAAGAESEENAAQLSAELNQAILGDESMPPLVEGAILVPKMNVSFFQDLLETVVVAIDQLALSTLDSFFVKLLRNFAFELGMSGFELIEGYDLEAERMRVFTDIFLRSNVPNAGGKNSVSAKQMDSFVAAFAQSSAGEESIRLRGRLEEFVKSHQYRWLKHPQENSWGNKDTIWPEEFPWPDGGNYRAKVKRGLELLEATSFPHKSYTKSLTAMFLSLEDRDGKEGTPLPSKCGRLPILMQHLPELAKGSFSDFAYKKDMLIEGELADVIYQLLGGLVSDEIKAKLERTQGVYAVVKAYEERYNRTVRGQGKLGFSDATILLSGHESVGLFDAVSKELVEYRFDGKYDHWMLDEFQDTSVSQWKVIRNLIDEVIFDGEGERSLFVVGDTKQGIYGWRGGEPKLFDDLAERYGDRISKWPMNVSWRSSQSVLDLVNKVCDPRSSGMRLFPLKAIDRWKFEAHSAGVERPGHSWVCEMEAIPDVTTADLKNLWIGSLVEKMSPVKRGISCAILVRKNDRAREIAEFLRENHPDIAVAVEDESLVAEENPVTAVLVDAFRFLCYPVDTLSWKHIVMSPFAPIFLAQYADQEDGLKPLQVWHHWNKELSERGVEQVLLNWVLELKKIINLSRYSISKLVELELAASEFTQRGGSLTEWLTILENWSQREVTRAGVVQIMTLHKAKGLGFDAVILPDLDDSAFDDEGRLHVLETSDEETGGHVLLPPVKAIRDADDKLSAQVAEWASNQCYEQFCVLYVMLTRAVHGTYCLLDATRDKPDKRKKNSADWIRESVAHCPDREEAMGDLIGRVSAEFGSWDWLDEHALTDPNNVEELVIDATILPTAQPRQKAVIASRHGKTNFAQRVMDRHGMDFGNAVHECFETIEWWDGNLNWSGDNTIRSIVTECMSKPSIAPYFTARAGLKVYREQPIEAIINGVWASGVIDRLIISYDKKGEVDNIAIVDFKTDKVEELEQLKELYHDQVERYKEMLASLYSINPNYIYGVLISTHHRSACTL